MAEAHLSHAHSELATHEQLNTLPFPLKCGPLHQPVPHGVLVTAIKSEAAARGYTPGRGKYALARGGRRMFGVMELTQPDVTWEDRSMAIGFRNSIDTSLAITVVAGARVFTCDNMVLSGDGSALWHRNTIGLDLAAAIKAGFDKFLEHARALHYQIGELQFASLSDEAAKAKLFDLFARRVLPLRLFEPVERYYFQATSATPDCQPRSLWGLHNACTRGLKQLHPARAFTANMALGTAFGLSHVQAPVGSWS